MSTITRTHAKRIGVEYLVRMRNMAVWTAILVLAAVQGFTLILVMDSLGTPVDTVMQFVGVWRGFMYALVLIAFGRPLVEMGLEWAWERYDLPRLEVAR